MNLNQLYPTPGFTGTSFTAPVISNLGFAGTMTSGSSLFYSAGGKERSYINWMNNSGSIVDQWSFTNSENRNDALALINAAILAGTAYVNLATSS